MPRIPRDEAGIIALAQQIKNGLNTNPNLVDSPVEKSDFTAKLDEFTAKRDTILVKKAELKVENEEKEEIEDDLREMMQRVVDFLDSKTGGDAEQLATVGVTASSAPNKQPPGQPRSLEIISQIDATIKLDWKSTSDGGRAKAYRIQRRELPAGDWEVCGATDETEIVLTNQPRGKELEYRIVGFNSNGDSIPSNTVAAVL